MIELNLLPDVKLEYIKAQRTRRLVLSICVLVTIAAIALLVGLLSIAGFQKKHLNDLNTDIGNQTKQLKDKRNINKVLTVQNQLESLTSLHAAKPAASRLTGYLNDVTPAQISISSMNIDFTTQKVDITGSADAISSVNKYVDTLKFTTYSTPGAAGTTGKAFKDVVLSTFGVTSSIKDNTPLVTYSIALTYDPVIFDITQKVKLVVPTLTTTRSTVNNPSDLFQASKANTTGKGN